MITVSKRQNSNRGSHVRDKTEPYLVNWFVSARPHIWHPPTDLFELENHFIVRVEIAGVAENDFVITLDQNLLSIQGMRVDHSERRVYHQMEVNFGEFYTAVEISGPIDSQTVTAEYQHGFLSVFLPKAVSQQIHIEE
jgi:HSP20 family protein